jgi:hypothetical protein
MAESLQVQERAARGKGARNEVPRASHASAGDNNFERLVIHPRNKSAPAG